MGLALDWTRPLRSPCGHQLASEFRPTTDFSGTNEISATGTTGEKWNFYGHPNDFKTTKALINTNYAPELGFQGGIPYYPGTSNPACLARSQAMGQLACRPVELGG